MKYEYEFVQFESPYIQHLSKEINELAKLGWRVIQVNTIAAPLISGQVIVVLVTLERVK